MASATFAEAITPTRGGWDRESTINAIQEWVATYGEPPRAADWNPSSAKWSGQLWRVERYRAGRADGSPWPSLNTAKRPFGGSLTAAVTAAGFAPAKPGPKRRSDVDPEQADRAVISPEGRAMLQAALAQARAAEQRIAVLEGRLARVAAARAAVAPKPKVVRERVVDDAAVARAQRAAAAAKAKAAVAVADAKEQVSTARADAAQARQAAGRLAAAVERSEASVVAAQADRRTSAAEAQRLADRLVATERLLAAARAQAGRTPAVVTVREEAPGAAAVRAAQAEAALARRTAREAEVRAARAERELRETVAAVRGEARALTATELAELRVVGPSGPAVLAAGLKGLAAARSSGNPTRLEAALLRVAEAAVTWRERI